jgi:hypothetical protein
MNTPDNNPYAAPQSDLSTLVPVATEIPMAKEVLPRKLFPEWDRAQLLRVLALSHQLRMIDVLYVMSCLPLFISLLYYLTSDRYGFDWTVNSLLLFVMLAYIIISIVAFSRSKAAMFLAIFRDACILMIFLYGIGWLIYEGGYTETPMFVFLSIMTVLLIEKRWKSSYFYGPDRIRHNDLQQEADYRRYYSVN